MNTIIAKVVCIVWPCPCGVQNCQNIAVQDKYSGEEITPFLQTHSDLDVQAGDTVCVTMFPRKHKLGKIISKF